MGIADGWGNRLRRGLASILVGNSYSESRGKRGTVSTDLNRVRDYMEMSGKGGFSQPVWGPELSTVGNYSREGYTSRTFDRPVIPFSDQVYYVNRDEDVQLALNHLTSQITGGEHYWKSEYDSMTDALSQFSQDIDFDWIDTILVKECLAYGNSVWKARLGIQNIRNRDDLMCIPISSFVRVWWDRQRRPYKFEFRGSEYQGYHNKEDIMHFVWNPINASAFGTGFMTALAAPRDFEDLTTTGTIDKRLPSLMDRKYSTAMTMHLTERRYIPRNVYKADGASQEEREQLKSDLTDPETGEDLVLGKKVEVQELGSNQRAFDPTLFTDLIQGGIFKALNDFRGKQGQEESHQYANAETSAMLDEIGLKSFPLAITRQLMEKLFQLWYESQGGITDMNYGGGIVTLPWKEANPELNFGRKQKIDLSTEDMIKLLDVALNSGALQDPIEIRKILEDAGLGLTKESTDSMQNQYNPAGPVYPADFNDPNFNTYQADQSQRSYDDPNFSTGNRDFEPNVQSMDASPSQTNSYHPQPSKVVYANTARQTRGKLPDELEIDDVNAFLANTGNGSETKSLDIKERELKLEEKRLRLETRKELQETLRKLNGRK